MEDTYPKPELRKFILKDGEFFEVKILYQEDLPDKVLVNDDYHGTTFVGKPLIGNVFRTEGGDEYVIHSRTKMCSSHVADLMALQIKEEAQEYMKKARAIMEKIQILANYANEKRSKNTKPGQPK